MSLKPVLTLLLLLSLVALGSEAARELRVSPHPVLLAERSGVVYIQVKPYLGQAVQEGEKIFFTAKRPGDATVELYYFDATVEEIHIRVLPAVRDSARGNSPNSVTADIGESWTDSRQRTSTQTVSARAEVGKRLDVSGNLRNTERRGSGPTSRDLEYDFRTILDDAYVAGKGSTPNPRYSMGSMAPSEAVYAGKDGDSRGFNWGFWRGLSESSGDSGAWASVPLMENSGVSLEAARDRWSFSLLEKEGEGETFFNRSSSKEASSLRLRHQRRFGRGKSGFQVTGVTAEYSSTAERGGGVAGGHDFYLATTHETGAVKTRMENSYSSSMNNFKNTLGASFLGENGFGVDAGYTHNSSSDAAYTHSADISLAKRINPNLKAGGGVSSYTGDYREVLSKNISLVATSGSDFFSAKVMHINGEDGLFWSLSGRKEAAKNLVVEASAEKRKNFNSKTVGVRKGSFWARASEVYQGAKRSERLEMGLTLDTGDIKPAIDSIYNSFSGYKGFVYVDRNLNGEHDEGEEKGLPASEVKIVNSSVFGTYSRPRIDASGMFSVSGFDPYQEYSVDFGDIQEGYLVYGDKRVSDKSGISEFRLVKTRGITAGIAQSGAGELGDAQVKIEVACEGGFKAAGIASPASPASFKVPENGRCQVYMPPNEFFYSVNPVVRLEPSKSSAYVAAGPVQRGFLGKASFDTKERPEYLLQNGKQIKMDEDGYFEADAVDEIEAPGYRCLTGRFFSRSEIVQVRCEKLTKKPKTSIRFGARTKGDK